MKDTRKELEHGNMEKRIAFNAQATSIQKQAHKVAYEYTAGIIREAPLFYYSESEIQNRYVTRYKIERRKAAGL